MITYKLSLLWPHHQQSCKYWKRKLQIHSTPCERDHSMGCIGPIPPPKTVGWASPSPAKPWRGCRGKTSGDRNPIQPYHCDLLQAASCFGSLRWGCLLLALPRPDSHMHCIFCIWFDSEKSVNEPDKFLETLADLPARHSGIGWASGFQNNSCCKSVQYGCIPPTSETSGTYFFRVIFLQGNYNWLIVNNKL